MVVQRARLIITSLICATLSLAGSLSAAAAELRIGLAAEVTTLDPQFLNIAPNNNAAWQIFDALVN
ncbi:MAG TPA: ABC transporter substrate-binding protein, partial [Burkholderiales bacterium]|nr:ABC transporter substrate-binding protein [Burkholderiales bacterium]